MPMSGKGAILLADDEFSILQTLRMVLEREGYEVIPAQSGDEALALLVQRKFDVIILDLSMERDDSGFEVARSALKLKPKPAIMIYTGYANLSNSRTALKLGVDYFAIKPIENEVFISALNKLVAKVRARRKAEPP